MRDGKRQFEILVSGVVAGCVLAVVVMHAEGNTPPTAAALMVCFGLVAGLGWLRYLVGENDRRIEHNERNADSATRLALHVDARVADIRRAAEAAAASNGDQIAALAERLDDLRFVGFDVGTTSATNTDNGNGES